MAVFTSGALVVLPVVGLTAWLSVRSRRRSNETLAVPIFGLNFGPLLRNTGTGSISLSFSASHPHLLSLFLTKLRSEFHFLELFSPMIIVT